MRTSKRRQIEEKSPDEDVEVVRRNYADTLSLALQLESMMLTKNEEGEESSKGTESTDNIVSRSHMKKLGFPPRRSNSDPFYRNKIPAAVRCSSIMSGSSSVPSDSTRKRSNVDYHRLGRDLPPDRNNNNISSVSSPGQTSRDDETKHGNDDNHHEIERYQSNGVQLVIMEDHEQEDIEELHATDDIICQSKEPIITAVQEEEDEWEDDDEDDDLHDNHERYQADEIITSFPLNAAVEHKKDTTTIAIKEEGNTKGRKNRKGRYESILSISKLKQKEKKHKKRAATLSAPENVLDEEKDNEEKPCLDLEFETPHHKLFKLSAAEAKEQSGCVSTRSNDDNVQYVVMQTNIMKEKDGHCFEYTSYACSTDNPTGVVHDLIEIIQK